MMIPKRIDEVMSQRLMYVCSIYPNHMVQPFTASYRPTPPSLCLVNLTVFVRRSRGHSPLGEPYNSYLGMCAPCIPGAALKFITFENRFARPHFRHLSAACQLELCICDRETPSLRALDDSFQLGFLFSESLQDKLERLQVRQVCYNVRPAWRISR